MPRWSLKQPIDPAELRWCCGEGGQAQSSPGALSHPWWPLGHLWLSTHKVLHSPSLPPVPRHPPCSSAMSKQGFSKRHQNTAREFLTNPRDQLFSPLLRKNPWCAQPCAGLCLSVCLSASLSPPALRLAYLFTYLFTCISFPGELCQGGSKVLCICKPHNL